MPSNPRIKALARQASEKIKALAEAHQTQITAIYQQFQEEAADIQGSSADELDTHIATPIPQSTVNRQEE